MRIDVVRLIRVHALATILNIFVFSSMYIFIPQLRDGLVEADQFLENLTAALFFAAFW